MNLKSIRVARHLSQEQLADIAGLNVRTIQRLENGSQPSTESLKCLASALEVDIADITQPTSNNVDITHTAPSNTVLYLVLASLFILFGAKSEAATPVIAALFYVAAAICFVLTSVHMHRKA